ncbi:hypothetical protein [Klebsiella pneumoniae]|uniref:hypothetical protein n=1 Tax=Klebsiella pneumoniae TaxID=573 RepID=UPI003F65944C
MSAKSSEWPLVFRHIGHRGAEAVLPPRPSGSGVKRQSPSSSASRGASSVLPS